LQCIPGYFCAKFFPYPAVWAVHDYDDPSSGMTGAHADIDRFLSSLYNLAIGAKHVWITESAVDLNDATTSDQNRSTGCYDGEEDHAVGNNQLASLGGCVDGNSGAQTNGAGDFRGLVSRSYGGITVTQADWYEFQAPNANTGWDSGLLAPWAPCSYQGSCWAQMSPDGDYGANFPIAPAQPFLRPSFCVLTQNTSTNCVTNKTDLSDWSIQPHAWTGDLTQGSFTVNNVVWNEKGSAPSTDYPIPGSWITCSDGTGNQTCTGLPANSQVCGAIGSGNGPWVVDLCANATATVSGARLEISAP
jgi:hypothetical protein